MTADRTQHVIDAIDGALSDWTVFGDAMRWTPSQPLADWEIALTADTFDPITFERAYLDGWTDRHGNAVVVGFDGSRGTGTIVIAATIYSEGTAGHRR